ncbi:TLD-domain-containing protein [Gigaspora rosea]|uniref:TLD-domain-containing protein n=1 Tax=Gigaspora rosea TaxID=44941 RepID=A0A397VSL8_9GLOM|nr:TLD-domain-containing protein [Gigaspora rosea]
MIVSCEFLLEELVKYLETYLIEKNAHWLLFQNKQFQELQKWCNDIAAKYPSKVFESENFATLQENALVSLIGRDDLQMEEVKIWNYVIQWGIAQNPGLPSDPKNWSGENFLALKITLQNCLPLIRYFQLSGDDITDKVKPYKKILEENLWEDLMQRFLTPNRPISSTILPPRIISSQVLPPRTTEPFSTVISEIHAAEIASWVDKKTETYSIVNNPYEFKLLIRGTRDGFTSESFWKLCDKQTNTVLVMKVKGTDEIFGGYNPIAWDQSVDDYTSCNDSFIFSLKNGTVQNSILSRVKEPKYALFYSLDCGPNFGSYGDLAMYTDFNWGDECYCSPHSYEKALRNTEDEYDFSVDEYEVYQIRKKE